MSIDKQIEEKNELVDLLEDIGHDWDSYIDECQENEEKPQHSYEDFHADSILDAGYRKATDVSEQIFEEIEKRLSMYSHIHKYAEEAKKVTEEFADGTPCEMSSVWDAIALHKNGWDDYETMCQLQENIQNIDKSRLLKEFEGDIAELKKKYTGEGK
ncbi:MAG: hypothetical protein J6V82_04445 [Clostridia bacterium]|nr:hypothetical protein [Bacteroidales bacterium]MBO5789572.1 hypothetical protein [Clostridia bacterium]MBO7150981.1 hypothetical protein [Clostridia bacterium]